MTGRDYVREALSEQSRRVPRPWGDAAADITAMGEAALLLVTVLENYRDAVEICRIYLQMTRNQSVTEGSIASLTNIGSVLIHSGADNLELGISVLREVRSMLINPPPGLAVTPNARYHVELNLAGGLLKAGRFEEADLHAAQAEFSMPGRWETLLVQANLLEKRGEYRRAISLSESSYTRWPRPVQDLFDSLMSGCWLKLLLSPESSGEPNRQHWIKSFVQVWHRRRDNDPLDLSRPQYQISLPPLNPSAVDLYYQLSGIRREGQTATPLPDHLYLYCEQGVGDRIMSLGLLYHLLLLWAARHKPKLRIVRPGPCRLLYRTLLSRAFPLLQAEMIDAQDRLGDQIQADRQSGTVSWLRTGDLTAPALFSWLPSSSIPGKQSWIVPDLSRFLFTEEQHRARRERTPGGYLALSLTGNAYHTSDYERSLSPSMIRDLLSLLGDPGPESYRRLDYGYPWKDSESMPLPATLEESISLLCSARDVLTVDSAPAHLCGILGIPCNLILPADPEWRWLTSLPSALPGQPSLYAPHVRVHRTERNMAEVFTHLIHQHR